MKNQLFKAFSLKNCIFVKYRKTPCIFFNKNYAKCFSLICLFSKCFFRCGIPQARPSAAMLLGQKGFCPWYPVIGSPVFYFWCFLPNIAKTIIPLFLQTVYQFSRLLRFLKQRNTDSICTKFFCKRKCFLEI